SSGRREHYARLAACRETLHPKVFGKVYKTNRAKWFADTSAPKIFSYTPGFRKRACMLIHPQPVGHKDASCSLPLFVSCPAVPLYTSQPWVSFHRGSPCRTVDASSVLYRSRLPVRDAV